MAGNKRVWFLRLLVALLGLHTSHCQEGNTEPSCVSSRSGEVYGERLECSNIKSFDYITPLLPTEPPGVDKFALTDSPDLQLASTDFDHKAFENTMMIKLERCNATAIHPEHFTSLPRLIALSILSNNLTEISSSSFLGLERLEFVDLTDNQITSVAADTFTNLHNLAGLDLSKNSLASITDNLFENQSNLTSLLLAQNGITVLNDNTFKGLVDLGSLDLSYNKIESISSGVFAELTQLSSLNLGYNNLQSLSPGLFQTNIELERLDLSGNDLVNLANYPLNIPSLQQLKLNAGKIQSIPVDYFANLKNVSSLSLSNNELSQFEDVLLEALSELHFLNLDSNKFTSLNLTAFRELNPTFAANVASYGELSVANNPWECSDPVGEDMVNLCEGRGVTV